LTVCVDLAPTGAYIVPHCSDAIAIDRDVSAARGSAASVYDLPTANHQVVHALSFAAASKRILPLEKPIPNKQTVLTVCL